MISVDMGCTVEIQGNVKLIENGIANPSGSMRDTRWVCDGATVMREQHCYNAEGR